MRKIGFSVVIFAFLISAGFYSSSCATRVPAQVTAGFLGQLVLTGLYCGPVCQDAESTRQSALKPAKRRPAETAPSSAVPPPVPTASSSGSQPIITERESPMAVGETAELTAITPNESIGTVPIAGTGAKIPKDSGIDIAVATDPAGSTGETSIRAMDEEASPTPPSFTAISDAEYFQTRIQDLFFDFDKYDLRSDQQPVADSNIRALAERPEIQFTIEGYSDERGSEKYDSALGDRRANTAKAYLVEHGIAEDRINTVSYGKKQPFEPGHNEAAWAKNRRAHFVFKEENHP